jgi:hypothetical protein
MKVKVLRALRANGEVYKAGDVVDLDGPNLQKLVEQRYLQPVEFVAADQSPQPRGKRKDS